MFRHWLSAGIAMGMLLGSASAVSAQNAAVADADAVSGTVSFGGPPVTLRYIYTRVAAFMPAGESENMFREVRILLSDRPLTEEDILNHTQDGQPRTIKFTGVRIDIRQPGTSWEGLQLFHAGGAGSHVERSETEGAFAGVTMTGLAYKDEALSASVHTDKPHGNPYGMPGTYSFDVKFTAPLQHDHK